MITRKPGLGLTRPASFGRAGLLYRLGSAG